MSKADWIAADWGTSNLRVWAMSNEGAVLAQAQSDKGMGGLASDEFEPALLDLIASWLPECSANTRVPVIACGMVGARQGWVEADYQTTPCKPTTTNLTKAPTKDPRITVLIAPGLSQMSPPDVMRGEETQIAGFLASEPEFDGVICLPGTHTKWVQISAGEIVSFQTFMSGELFALMAEHSVLRHSVQSDEWDEEAFADALSDTLSRPASVASKLFSLRAASLLQDQSPATTRARLSGLLIGLELGGARPYWLGQDIVLLGDPKLTELYQSALASQGATARTTPVEALTLLGLAQAYAQKKDRTS